MRHTAMVYVLVGLAVGWVLRSWTSDRTAYTLYRNSATGITERIHIATFDADEADAYNNENCQQAQTLFQQQPGAIVKFWCEKGPYRR